MIEVRTGCRLHFGLMELAEGAPNRYAGFGVMLQSPRIQIAIGADVGLAAEIDSTSFEEYQQRIGTLLEKLGFDQPVKLIDGYPFHSGLGAGTQLACSLAVAKQFLSQQNSDSTFSRWIQVRELLPDWDAAKLAASSGRGLRSAIGLQGFLSGGLILDEGYRSDSFSHRTVQASQVNMPESWRFVLIRGVHSSAITGALESSMIGRMASRDNPQRQRMLHLARQAQDQAANGQFSEFCEALEEYMSYAGDLFAPIQGGGRFNGAVCTQAAEVAMQQGLRAVGQSSWGPTIFGLANNSEQAERIANNIQKQANNWHVEVAAAANTGAMVRVG